LAKRMPATTTAFLVGAIGGLGIFPFGVFWAMHRGITSLWEQPLLIGVILLTNALNGLSLARVYRLVFLGPIQPKTRRAVEAPWAMAFPMVTLTILTLLFPLLLHQLELLPSLSQINGLVVGLLTASTVLGAMARPIQPVRRFLQDLVADDFYVAQFYQVTVVWAVASLSKLVYWFDRFIVDGFINLIGFASILSGEGLKYSVSGRSQGYMLTILLGVGLIGLYLSWSRGHLAGLPF
jgi:NAD(P)H-quinone oxidoreductase subunit 5